MKSRRGTVSFHCERGWGVVGGDRAAGMCERHSVCQEDMGKRPHGCKSMCVCVCLYSTQPQTHTHTHTHTSMNTCMKTNTDQQFPASYLTVFSVNVQLDFVTQILGKRLILTNHSLEVELAKQNPCKQLVHF